MVGRARIAALAAFAAAFACAPAVAQADISVDVAPTHARAGQAIAVEYTVTNHDLLLPVSSVTVTDDSCSPVTTSDSGALGPNETRTFSCSATPAAGETVFFGRAVAEAIDPVLGAVSDTKPYHVNILDSKAEL